MFTEEEAILNVPPAACVVEACCSSVFGEEMSCTPLPSGSVDTEPGTFPPSQMNT